MALKRLVITPYAPQPALDSFRARAQTQSSPLAEVTVAVLDARESERFFGVPMARRGLQPVHLRVVNRGQAPLRLLLAQIDPNYYTPLEAAAANHFSIVKRLSSFGLIGLFFFWMLLLIPSKLITAWLANRRMDDFFRLQALHLRPIGPGEASEGFVFTPLDAGTKIVHVALHATGESLADAARRAQESGPMTPAAEFTFSIPVPGLSADYLRRDFAALDAPAALVACDEAALVTRLAAMPPATANAKGTRPGDPVNLVVIGEFEILLGAFAARWDESETITLATCWKTMRSFLLGSQYRYSPVSALHLFGRSQDIALQRSRGSINERLHLRLWLTPLRFQNHAGVGRPGEPRHRRPLHPADLEPDHAPRRPRRRRSPRLRDRRPAASRADRSRRLRRRRRRLRARQAPPQPDRRPLFHRRQAGRRDAVQLAHEAEICRLGVRRSSCQLTREA